MALQADGKIVLAGSCATDQASSDFALVRYNQNGSLDTSFDGDGRVLTEFSGGIDGANALALQTDGKIVAAGHSSNGLNYDFALVRYNADGVLDTSFDGDGKVTTGVSTSFEDVATSIAIQSDGKIISAGYLTHDSLFDFALVRHNPDGSLDSSYGTAGKAVFDFYFEDLVFDIALDSIGRVVVAGELGGLFTVARILGGTGAAPVANSPFDFDGDGKSDISIFRPGAGEWWINRSSSGATIAAQFGNSSDKIVPADFTGDGRADIAVWRGATGEWFILRSEDGSFYSIPFGTAGDVPVPADFDGDGRADLAVYRPSTSVWFVNRSSGGTQILSFGAAGDLPVAGDYDGDGKADIAIFRPVSGEWWINNSSTSSTSVFQFGNSTDRPVPGDYTGDGRTDVAYWRPSTGVWFILRSEDGSFYSVPFGAPGDVPVAGDYDGDGKFDTAVFRPAAANWFINRSTSGILITAFGTAGDTPVPAAYLP